MELPRRTTAPRANDAGPDPRAARPAAAEPQTVGGRFDRGLRRVNREQTSLLSWLAESDTAGVLRTTAEIDLRDQPTIDVDAAATVTDEVGLRDGIEVTDGLGLPVDSAFPR